MSVVTVHVHQGAGCCWLRQEDGFYETSSCYYSRLFYQYRVQIWVGVAEECNRKLPEREYVPQHYTALTSLSEGTGRKFGIKF